MRKLILVLIGLVAGVALFGYLGVVVLIHTEWGQERVRQLVVRVANGQVHGKVRIGGVSGDLLSGIVLHDVSITDSAGAPFLTAQALEAHYDLESLYYQRIALSHVRLINPVIVLDRQPGGRWNWDRLFSTGPPSTKATPSPGWGTWVTLSDVQIVHGALMTRSPWTPSARYTGRARDSVIRYTMGDKSRKNVQRVPGGFQQIASFHDVNAALPLVRLADPHFVSMLVTVSSASAIAQPLKPPAIAVENVNGAFNFTTDSAWWRSVQVTLPHSQLRGDGWYDIATADLRLQAEADTAVSNDFGWIEPTLPRGMHGRLKIALAWVGDSSAYHVHDASLHFVSASLQGNADLAVLDTIAVESADVRWTGVDSRVVQKLTTTKPPAWPGTIAGQAKIHGGVHALAIDGRLVYEETHAGRNEVAAHGVVSLANGGSARDLRVDLLAIQGSLGVLIAAKDTLPGVFSGHATVNGSFSDTVTLTDLVLTHTQPSGVSQVSGHARVAMGGKHPVEADLQLDSIALATVSPFVPKAKIQGSISGSVHVNGTLDSAHVIGDLALKGPIAGGGSDAGHVRLDAAVNWADTAAIRYDATVTMTNVNAGVMTPIAPRTSVTGVVAASGTGFDPATAVGTLHVALAPIVVDTVVLDSVRAVAHIANGLANVDTVDVRARGNRATAAGTLGLVAGRDGQVRYRVALDSLAVLQRYLPPADTGIVPPRPAILAQRVSAARSDSAREAKRSEVERAATGKRLTTFAVDTPKAVAANAMSGTIHLEGSLQGNVHHFSTNGTVTGRALTVRGNIVDRLTATYDWSDAPARTSLMKAQMEAQGVRALGFALDTVHATATYQDSAGTLRLSVGESNHQQYRLAMTYIGIPTGQQVEISELGLRLDTATWVLAHPATIRLRGGDIVVDTFDLRNGHAGRIYISGSVPAQSPMHLQLKLEGLRFGDVAALMQTAIPAYGEVGADIDLTGTRADPAIRGSFAVTNVKYAGQALFGARGTVDDATQSLGLKMDATRDSGQVALHAEGTVPVNLAFSSVQGSRVPSGKSMALTVATDSFPLDVIPQVTTVVSDLRGQISGKFSITGPLTQPTVTGRLVIANGGARIIPLGIRLTNIQGSLRASGDTLVVDSIAAYSEGRLALTGGVVLATLAKPSLDLHFRADRARVIDTREARLHADVDLQIHGPFDAVRIDGIVHLPDGELYLKESTNKKPLKANDPVLFQVLDTTLAVNQSLLDRPSPLMAHLRVNVQVQIDRDVFVRTPDANVEVYTRDPLRVHVNQARQRISVDGTILSDRGEYNYLSKRFNILSAAVTFIPTEGLNPRLQITGQYPVQLPGREAINIRILIGGTLDFPTISLESDAQPPISQSDLLSYLAFGRSSSSLTQLEGSALASATAGGNLIGQSAALASRQLAGVALGVLTDQLNGQATRSLGLDVFRITPADVQNDVGGFLRGTEVRFGKYVRGNTFYALQSRFDPQALQRPGFQLQHWFGYRNSYRLDASFEPRFIPPAPSLRLDDPVTTSVFGLFLIREWRY